MEWEADAAGASKFTKSVDFQPSKVAFDAPFEA